LAGGGLHLKPTRLFLIAALIGAFFFVFGRAESAPIAATASVSPQVQYLGDSAGKLFTFTVTNTGTSGIGIVQIQAAFTQPTNLSPIQLALFGDVLEPMACPGAPAGWSVTAAHETCTFVSGPDIAPGASSSAFQVVAKSPAGTQDMTASWHVRVAADQA